MRAIKFRAWETGEETMHSNVQVGVYQDPDEWIEFHYILELERFKVMQNTGLKDQNGAEIYEGDICKTLFGVKGEVVFDCGSFKLKNKQDLYSIGKLPELIGNIYENPELLSNHDTSKTQ